MFTKGDNGDTDNCRQNIKHCKHGEDQKKKRHGGDRGNTEAIFCSSVSEGKKKLDSQNRGLSTVYKDGG